MKFGLFVEFDSIFTGLLHYLEMDPNFYQRFKNGEFKENSELDFYISKIDHKNQIVLSSRAKIDWDSFKEKYEGQSLRGTIKTQKPFGVFVEFDIDGDILTGLYKTANPHYKFNIGSEQEFIINRVLVEDKKFFLSIS
jgi:ribosomal protein S1